MRTGLALLALAVVLAGCADVPLGPIKERRLDPGKRGPQFSSSR